ncbi:MAG TPA: response regulator, partial [Nitrospira sp.]|nr:response regulator [Nitrospira sp.]
MAKASILIVEDEAIVAADLADKLERAGYAIAGTVSRGEQAVRMVRQNRPDLILMDIRLAGPLDGIEVAESLKTSTDVPVVFLSAHSDDQTIGRAGLTDPFGYILKPFEERDLKTQIEIALYRYRAERALRDSEERYRAQYGNVPAKQVFPWI